MDNYGEIVIFRNEEGNIKVQIDAVNETIWLNQKGMSELFGVGQASISKHLSNIFESGELERDSVYSILEYTADDGKKYQTQFYNLEYYSHNE